MGYQRKEKNSSTPFDIQALLDFLNADPSDEDWGAMRTRLRASIAKYAKDSASFALQHPLPPHSVISHSKGFMVAWGRGLELLASDEGRQANLRCCPTCRHFFLADHGHQAYCLPTCRPERPKTKRDRAEYMRQYRKAKTALKRGRLRARVRARLKKLAL